ncbi:hypothetical protein BH24ACI3_BH24ACI3_12070 [soil metagenome]
MPLNVNKFWTSVLAVLFGSFAIINAQTLPPAPAIEPVAAKSPAEVMRDRISASKALIAVRNYNAAIVELESIRRETTEPPVIAVVNVLLMNSFLEQGNYAHARTFLQDFFTSYKSNNAHSEVYYQAVAGQVVKGARNQIDRYRSLGLTVAERNLPLQAINDIEQMRETLELVVTQAKEIGEDKARAAIAMPLLEEATSARTMLARDEYDAARWRNEMADSREQIAHSRSVVTTAVAMDAAAPPRTPQTVTLEQLNAAATAETQPAAVPSETTLAANDKPIAATPKPEPRPERPVRVVSSAPPTAKPEPADASTAESEQGSITAVNTEPMEAGSLIGFASRQFAPVYPPTARQMRTTGVVRVEIVVNEDGEVAEVINSSGPTLLQPAAKDAIKRWRFRPFTRDGQPVKATGFVNFNFSL